MNEVQIHNMFENLLRSMHPDLETYDPVKKNSALVEVANIVIDEKKKSNKHKVITKYIKIVHWSDAKGGV